MTGAHLLRFRIVRLDRQEKRGYRGQYWLRVDCPSCMDPFFGHREYVPYEVGAPTVRELVKHVRAHRERIRFGVAP